MLIGTLGMIFYVSKYNKLKLQLLKLNFQYIIFV